jgi:hypothetical protein
MLQIPKGFDRVMAYECGALGNGMIRAEHVLPGLPLKCADNLRRKIMRRRLSADVGRGFRTELLENPYDAMGAEGAVLFHMPVMTVIGQAKVKALIGAMSSNRTTPRPTPLPNPLHA